MVTLTTLLKYFFNATLILQLSAQKIWLLIEVYRLLSTYVILFRCMPAKCTEYKKYFYSYSAVSLITVTWLTSNLLEIYSRRMMDRLYTDINRSADVS